MIINLPVKLAFLASGRGSNMQAIISACNRGLLPAQPVVVISNNPSSGALERARQENIPGIHVSTINFPEPSELDIKIVDILREYQVNLIILAGYMKKLGKVVLEEFDNRIINIHPSLLPDYGGKGMYGTRVHEAVIAAGEKQTGITVHLVNSEYDQGQILAQKFIDIHPDEAAGDLAKRVLELEHSFYTDVLGEIFKGNIILPNITFNPD